MTAIDITIFVVRHGADLPPMTLRLEAVHEVWRAGQVQWDGRPAGEGWRDFRRAVLDEVARQLDPDELLPVHDDALRRLGLTCVRASWVSPAGDHCAAGVWPVGERLGP